MNSIAIIFIQLLIVNVKSKKFLIIFNRKLLKIRYKYGFIYFLIV